MQLTKIAVVGTGVVGEGVMEAWRFRGYPYVKGYDVNPATIQRHQDAGLDVSHMDQFGESQADLVFVCVNTPQGDDGSVNLNYLKSALETIGAWIKTRQGKYPMIVQRSTTLPTLSRNWIVPLLETASGLICGEGFGYAHLPEILRETEAVEDSLQIWKVVIGEYDARTADHLETMFGPILGNYKDKLLARVPVEEAEAAKYIFNLYNAAKISFFNMMGLYLQHLGIDGQSAIDLAAQMGEGTLNPLYGTLIGRPYGGMCLPKDTAALLYQASKLGFDLPMLAATIEVNHLMLELAAQGQVPHPVRNGFRRFTAEEMRLAVLNAADRLQGDNK